MSVDLALYLDIFVSFNQSTYSVDEDDGPAQPVLVLSDPSSTDITVQVESNDITATGKWTNITFNSMLTVRILQEVLIMILDPTLSHFLLERPLFHLMFQ